MTEKAERDKKKHYFSQLGFTPFSKSGYNFLQPF